jgi:hypothetical protein
VKQIVEFPLENGDSILVEVDQPVAIDDRISLGDDVIQKAQLRSCTILNKPLNPPRT